SASTFRGLRYPLTRLLRSGVRVPTHSRDHLAGTPVSTFGRPAVLGGPLLIVSARTLAHSSPSSVRSATGSAMLQEPKPTNPARTRAASSRLRVPHRAATARPARADRVARTAPPVTAAGTATSR